MKFKTGHWVNYNGRKVRFAEGMNVEDCKPVLIKYHILRVNGFFPINRIRVGSPLKKFDLGNGYTLDVLAGRRKVSPLYKDGTFVKNVRYIHQLQDILPEKDFDMFLDKPIDFYKLVEEKKLVTITKGNFNPMMEMGFRCIAEDLDKMGYGENCQYEKVIMKHHLWCEWEDLCNELVKKSAQGIAHAK